jgi:hypothetical protein
VWAVDIIKGAKILSERFARDIHSREREPVETRSLEQPVGSIEDARSEIWRDGSETAEPDSRQI